LIFVDSSFFIAVAHKKDRWHQRAVELVSELHDKELVTELVVAESVTAVGAIGGGKAGEDVYEYIVGNCEIVFMDRELMENAIRTYLKYDGTLSVADAVSVEVMRSRGINKIVSFDADFDKVAGISRIH
jgi:predicted nucleic acid-binding protein